MSLRSPHSPRSFASAALAATLALATGCQTTRGAPRGRTEPVCAVQDCATGRILDDGCADDGRCASCVNACAPSPTTSR
jgi:hypothetical protein